MNMAEENGDLLDEAKKRLSVERIYQKKTQLEHILLRPDTYIGSVEEAAQPMYVYDEEKDAIVCRQVSFVPGLYKIFDEILVNAADNKQRDPSMTMIKITIDPENNLISVWNNGRGIPVEMHSKEKVYVPELIFGTLLTSSNYNDEERKVTGGRNGYGAKLCNIFSTEFTVETASKESGKLFKQTWKDNMGVAGKVSITSSKSDYTMVSFKPDLAKFKMTHLDKDTVALMTRRAYDIAGCTRGVSVTLNGKKLPIKSFKDYVDLYLKEYPPGDEDEDIPRKVVHEVVNPRWEVCITVSPSGFQQASFVNSIATTKGGTHVAYVVDQLVAKLLEAAKKRNKGGMDLKPFHIKNHLWVFVNCLIENPTFDSQTKENMTLKAKSFGSTCTLSDKFLKQANTCGVVERVLNWARVKSQSQLNKKQGGSKHSRLRGIPKLDDANEAGGKNALDCTLIVTEGDSAKSLAVSGLGVIGRDNYGVFPLRGKLLNVREASHAQIIKNEEITNMVKILGLQYGKKYIDDADLKTLRYGHLMIMADQDQDGSHIKGLVINFIHTNWPHLLKRNFVEEFITPLVKVSKGSQEKPFFSLPQFEKWKAETENAHTWRVKYYKGLGTSTAKEAKEYFSDMDRHRIPFRYEGESDDKAIELAFSKKQADNRKEWLTSWLQHRNELRGQGLNDSYLYGEQIDFISFADFINKELILFSNMDNERSIGSVVDGLKPGQRKVLYTCFKRNDKREVKVAQLAGSVAEHSAYHHGEQSLMSTIINLAQTFVGSNNLNLLLPIGQFGTRLHGGKDAASPRYIFTKLSPLARLLFPAVDDNLLAYQFEDNMKIEPEWYCPILPMVLVNGCEGIGTGFSTNVPNYDVREIVTNLKALLAGRPATDMKPSFKGFHGLVAHVEPYKFMAYGRVARLNDTSLEITELPVRCWTQTYKENVLEVMLHGTEKEAPFISDYKEYHTDTTVRFVVNLSAEKMEEASRANAYKKFKLESSFTTSNMVLFDHNGCLKRYASVVDILQEFYDVRLDLYRKRKEWLEGQLTAEASRLHHQARFILEKIDGKIVVENKKKAEMIEILRKAGYPSDPVKAWKESISTPEERSSEREDGEEEEEEGREDVAEKVGKGQPDYNYLLGMQLWSLTKEKKDEMIQNRDKKAEELRILKEKTPKDLWNDDLDKFLQELDIVEEKEKEEEAAGAKIVAKKKGKAPKAGARQAKLAAASSDLNTSFKATKPSPYAESIEPQVPAYNAEPKKKKTTKVKTAEVGADKSQVSEGADNSVDGVGAGDEADNCGVGESDDVVETSADLSETKAPKAVETKPVKPKSIPTTKLDKPLQTSADDPIDVDEMDDDFQPAKPAAKPSTGAVKSTATGAGTSGDVLAAGTSTVAAGTKRPPPLGAKKPGPKSKKAALSGSEKPTKTLDQFDFWSELKKTAKPEV
eukprot:Em0012g708a